MQNAHRVFTLLAAALLAVVPLSAGAQQPVSQMVRSAGALTTKAVERMLFDDAGVSSRTIVYKQTTNAKLTLDVFRSADLKTSGSVPCIVFFFGGGWKTGSPHLFYPQCRYFARRGMVAVAADYRTEKRHGAKPFDCVADGKSAIRWVRAHAAELGIDPNRIVASGGSAGGHVAASTAMVSKFDDPHDNLSVSAKPNALVLFNPVIDNSPGGYGNNRIGDSWPDFSPMNNIKPGAPPTIFMLGTKDKLIPVATAQKYKELMDKAGSRCDVYLYEGQPHGFYGSRNRREGGRENPYLPVTLYHADVFLQSIHYTEGKPLLPEPAVPFVKL